MKDNEYMENIDELMKFVFEGRLLDGDHQSERRRLQELKSYGILEENANITECYKQILSLLNDNKLYILDALYTKNNDKELKQERTLKILFWQVGTFIAALLSVYLILIYPVFGSMVFSSIILFGIFNYIWHVNPTIQTKREYLKAIKTIENRIRMYGAFLGENKELVKENENEERHKEENRLEAIPKEIEYYYALIKDNKYEGYLNDAKELSSIYHKYIEITMPSDDLTKDNYQINLVLNDKLSKLLNDLNALERKIDLNIKKQERQEFYQSRISTLDKELAVDKLDVSYDSKPLKRTLKKWKFAIIIR